MNMKQVTCNKIAKMLLVFSMPILLSSCALSHNIKPRAKKWTPEKARQNILEFQKKKLRRFEKQGGEGNISEKDIVVTQDYFTDFYCYDAEKWVTYTRGGIEYRLRPAVPGKLYYRLRKIYFADVEHSYLKAPKPVMQVFAPIVSLGLIGITGDYKLSVVLSPGNNVPIALHGESPFKVPKFLDDGSYDIEEPSVTGVDIGESGEVISWWQNIFPFWIYYGLYGHKNIKGAKTGEAILYLAEQAKLDNI